MITVELINHLRSIATHNVHSSTIEWFIESCYRYYSKTYHTPLHEAKKILSPPEVILIFFEDTINTLPAESQLNNKNKWLAARQPFFPQSSVESDLYVDEEAEEEALLDSLIKTLQQEGQQQSKPNQSTPMNNTVQSNIQPPITPPQEETIQFDIPPEI